MTEVILVGLFLAHVACWALVTVLARMSDPVGMNDR